MNHQKKLKMVSFRFFLQCLLMWLIVNMVLAPVLVYDSSVLAQNLSNTIIAPNLVVPAVVTSAQPIPDATLNPMGATGDAQFEAAVTTEFNACGGSSTALDLANKAAQDALMKNLQDRAMKGKNKTDSSSGTCPQGAGSFTAADCKTTDILNGKSCGSVDGSCSDFTSCSCNDYIESKGVGSSGDDASINFFDKGNMLADIKRKNDFKKWLESFSSFCQTAGKTDIDKEETIINCQLKALTHAASVATQSLGQSLARNQAAYKNITDYHKALQGQYAAINTQLNGGPDSAEPKGLLGLQKFFTDQDATWSKNQVTIPQEVADYNKAQTDYINFPIKSRMMSFDMCMQANTNANSGATVSNQCYDYRGIYTANKQPGMVSLGPLQYLDCITYQKAYSNAATNGATGAGTDEGNADSAAMQKIISNLIANTGGAVSQPAPGQTVTVSNMNIPPLTTWAQIQQQVNTMFTQNPITINNQAAPTLTSQLQASLLNNLAACWNAAVSTTQFDNEKAAITKTWTTEQATVSTDFKTMNDSMVKGYQVLQAYLNKNHTSPSACNPADIQNFGACFTANHALVMNMVNGNTPGAFSDQLIPSTSPGLLPPFRAPCSQGLAQCITNLTNYRDVNIKGTIDSVTVPKMNDFTTKQDADIRAQYTNYGTKLTQLQGSIMATLAGIPGIDITGFTASLTPAGSLSNRCPGSSDSSASGGGQLPCLTAPDGGGPLSALSAMVSGAGGEKGGLMVGPSNAGIAKAILDARNALAKQASDIKSKVADMEKSLDGLDKIKKDVYSSKKCDGSDLVVDKTSNPQECTNCATQIDTCLEKERAACTSTDTGVLTNTSTLQSMGVDPDDNSGTGQILKRDNSSGDNGCQLTDDTEFIGNLKSIEQAANDAKALIDQKTLTDDQDHLEETIQGNKLTLNDLTGEKCSQIEQTCKVCIEKKILIYNQFNGPKSRAVDKGTGNGD